MTLLGQRPIQDLQLYAKVIKFLNPLIYIPQIKHRPRPARSRNKKELWISPRYPSVLNDGICLTSVWEADRLIERSNVLKWSRFSNMYVALKFLFQLIFVFLLFQIH